MSTPSAPKNTGPSGVDKHLRLSPARVRAVVRVLDVGLIVVAAVIARALTEAGSGGGQAFWFVVVCAVLVALDLFAAAGLYRPRDLGHLHRQIRRVVVAWSAVQALLFLLATVAGSTEALSVSFF